MELSKGQLAMLYAFREPDPPPAATGAYHLERLHSCLIIIFILKLHLLGYKRCKVSHRGVGLFVLGGLGSWPIASLLDLSCQWTESLTFDTKLLHILSNGFAGSLYK